MNGIPVNNFDVNRMVYLRETGHSLPEIMSLVKRGSSTVFKYIKDVKVLPEYQDQLKAKQGGSRARANDKWSSAGANAHEMIGSILPSQLKLVLLIGLYWGEGTKNELNLVNSDPGLIKVFIACLLELGIRKEDLRITLRLYNGIDKQEAITFWSDFLFIEPKEIRNVNYIPGKKVGKLKYGMCRVRVAKSAPYFKLVISLINEVRYQFDAAVVQRIEQGTPKP